MCPKLAVALTFVLTCLPGLSQVVPSGYKNNASSLSAGLGVSNYYPDLGKGRMYGGTLWADYQLSQVPDFLHGLGLEIEARDISLDAAPSEQIIREDSIGGGVSYRLLWLPRFQPYAKVIIGVGNADYYVGNRHRFNQSRTMTSFGGGFDVHAYKAVWVRVDYEYQYFPDFFLGTKAQPNNAPLDPQGFTLGAMYHFGKKSNDR
jgi:hypothetical protein